LLKTKLWSYFALFLYLIRVVQIGYECSVNLVDSRWFVSVF